MDTTRIFVPSELFAPAESSSFEGSFSLPVMDAGPDRYEFDKPLSWHVMFSNTGDAILVSGTVEGRAQTACARCLESFSFDISGALEGYYLLDAEQTTPEEMDEDEFEVLPDDKVIDIEPLIKAALLLELPLVPLCKEDCEGLCSHCGANLNEGYCSCSAADCEEDLPPNPFAVLKDFPFDSD